MKCKETQFGLTVIDPTVSFRKKAQGEWLPFVVSFGWWEAGLGEILAPFLFLC